MTHWTLAARAAKMNPSVIREILKVTEKPGIISLAGGLPSPKTFPVDAFAKACEVVLGHDGASALQYAASEGYGPLREQLAAFMTQPSGEVSMAIAPKARPSRPADPISTTSTPRILLSK